MMVKEYGVYRETRDGQTCSKGKYCCAVFRVTLEGLPFTDEQVVRLFPKAHGRTVSATRVTASGGATVWDMLLNNKRQCTAADIKYKLADALGIARNDRRIKVTVRMAVPEQGSHDHTGTSRAGMKAPSKSDAFEDTHSVCL